MNIQIVLTHDLHSKLNNKSLWQGEIPYRW